MKRTILIIAVVLIGAAAFVMGVNLRSARTDVVSDGRTLQGFEALERQGPARRTYTLPISEQMIQLGMGFSTEGWTYGGSIPGPIIEANEGDTVVVNIPTPHGDVGHGFDTHAMNLPMEHMGPVRPGETLSITGVADTPGVYMYHCSSGPVTDMHVKSGLYGAMIVYPKQMRKAAKEMVVVESGLFGKPDAKGFIARDTDMMGANNPFTLMFNGKLEHDPTHLHKGDLVRIYFVNIGPGDAAVHVVGTLIDRFYASGNPENVLTKVQTATVPPGGGATIEFYVPENGMFAFVDHNNLRYLPFGLAIPFMAH